MGYCNIYKIDTFNDVGKGFCYVKLVGIDSQFLVPKFWVRNESLMCLCRKGSLFKDCILTNDIVFYMGILRYIKEVEYHDGDCVDGIMRNVNFIKLFKMIKIQDVY